MNILEAEIIREKLTKVPSPMAIIHLNIKPKETPPKSKLIKESIILKEFKFYHKYHNYKAFLFLIKII